MRRSSSFGEKQTKRALPEVIWILFDLDNGHEKGKRYLWYFETEGAARTFKREHIAQGYTVQLSKPVCYELSSHA